MKRSLMFCLLLVAGLLLTRDAGLFAQPARTLRIGIVMDGPWERNETLRDLLQREIKEVLGTDTPVAFPPEAFLVGDWTLPRVRTLNSRLLEDPAIDVVLGMGLISSQDLATRGPLSKPVIAPVIIDAKRQHIPLHNGTSGVRNLNYLMYPYTFMRDLSLFREIVPIRKLVTIASKPYNDVLPPPSAAELEQIRKLGVELTEIRLGFSADDVIKELPDSVDAVFLEPNLHVPPAEFKKLLQVFIARRIPSFSFMGAPDVEQGVMASANPDILPRMARRVAMNLQRIVDGEEPGSLSVAFTPGKRLTINMRTAYAVGVSPRWSTLLEAELVQIDSTFPEGISLTLEDAIRRFSEDNLDVQAKIQEVSAAATNITSARAALLPRIDLGATGLQIDKEHAQAGGQPEQSGTFQMSGSQVILAEPAMANVSIQSSLQDSRERELDIARLNTIVEGSTYYINYLRARKLFYLLLDNLKLTRTNLELARVRQTTGAAGQEETLRWEVEIASLRKTAMDVQSQMNQALYALKQVLNIPLLYAVNVADISLDDTSLFISNKRMRSFLEDPLSSEMLSDFLVSEGARLSPELQQLDNVIAAQERALSSARLSYVLPTISAFGNYSDRFYTSEIRSPFQLPSLGSAPPPGTPGEAFLYQMLGGISVPIPGRKSWNLGLQVSLNLFNGFNTRATEERAAMQLDQARLQRQGAVDKVALRIRIEMEKAKASYFAVQQATLQQNAARRTLEIVTEGYSRGAVSMLSLLDAQNAALQVDQVAANAYYDLLTNYISLERAIGEFDVLLSPQDRADVMERLMNHMNAVLKR